MHGARKIARDYIAPMIRTDMVILDVCCGDRWVKKEFCPSHGDPYIGLDLKYGYDLTQCDNPNPAHPENPDLILSIYGLQHLLSEEARAWTLLRRIAKPTTKFVYVGRYAIAPVRETNREDPLNAYNQATLSGLALASGWRISDFRTFSYEGDSYSTHEDDENFPCNAFCASLEPIQ